MPNREHLTRKVPRVHPTWLAISAALRPWRIRCGMRAIAAGVNMVGLGISIVPLKKDTRVGVLWLSHLSHTLQKSAVVMPQLAGEE
jgi:hypothetical protein